MPKYAYYYLDNVRLVYSNNQDFPQYNYDQQFKVIDYTSRPAGRYGYQRYADVFIGIKNEYDQPVDSNYATIYYRENFNGSLTGILTESFAGTNKGFV